ncbi:hypothetical protein VXS03_07100 [Photobacterium sp. S4TG1]|uniref:hypothetical protein n=1 Tax=Photobacterium sp. S4TG1 TaxID=3114587 RepID=UPI002E17BE96|nr:hypothetical protein [Photobacterium sp. S4TG1]
MNNLIQTLIVKYGNVTKTAKAFSVSHTAVVKWKKNGPPLHIALLCHLSEDIPYIFNPSDYGVDDKGLKLNLETTKKVTTNDSIKRVRDTDANYHRSTP